MNFKNSLMFLSLLAYSLQTNSAAPGMKHYKEIKTMAEYDAVMKSYKPQVLKFYTDSCGACKSMEPVFNNVAGKENHYADFSAINVENDSFKGLIEKHSLQAVPTTLFIKSGKEIKRDKGSMTEADFDAQVKSFAKS